MKLPFASFIRRLFLLQLLFLLLLGALAGVREHHHAEISAAGRVIRRAAEAIIDTQALVKLELMQAPDDRAEAEQLRREISGLLDALLSGCPAQDLEPLEDRNYREELSRLYMQWRKLDSLIDVCRSSPETSIHLFMLSVEYYHQAGVTLTAAEQYSARLMRLVRLEKIAGGILWTLIVLTALYGIVETRRARQQPA